MPRSLRLTLNEQQREELEITASRHRYPYVRERAAALLQIANGLSGRFVALNSPGKPRKPDTIYSWYYRYINNGLNGLLIRSRHLQKNTK